MKRRFASVLALALLTPHVAKADPTTTWYGYQTLLVDGAAVGLVAGGVATDHAALGAGSGALTYLFAAPVVHLLNDNRPGAGRSLVLRLLAPLGGALLGAGLGLAVEGKGSYAGLAPIVFGGGGALLGAGTASLVDAFAFAHTKTSDATVTAVPSLAVTPTSATLTVGGRF